MAAPPRVNAAVMVLLIGAAELWRYRQVLLLAAGLGWRERQAG